MAVVTKSHKNYLTHFVGLPSKSKYRYRLIDFKNSRFKTNVLLSQSECNLEVLKEGIMVVGAFPEEDSIIPVLREEIEAITLERGKEVIDTFYLSPMHVLSKLGVPNRISRFLSFFPWEYKITETRIIIRCKDKQFKLITNGHRYDRLRRTFMNSGYAATLETVENPSQNVLNYTT